MYCPKCGAAIKDGVQFCPHCGEKINNISNGYIKSTNPLSIFREEATFLKYYGNGNDFCVYPNISESKRASARQYFNISRDETILLIRDTGIWNVGNQGAVVTDKAIYIIYDNESFDEGTRFNWEWQMLKKAEYQELNIYFYDQEGNNCPLGMGYFIKDLSDARTVRRVGERLATVFTGMAQSVKPTETPTDIINKLIEQDKNQEAADALLECIKLEPDNSSYYYEWLGRVYLYKLNDMQKAYDAFSKGLADANLENTTWVAQLKYYLYGVMLSDPDREYGIIDVRKNALYAAVYGDDEDNSYGKNHDITLRKDATDDFFELDDKFCEIFLDMPYNNRKALLTVDQYSDLNQNSLQIITKDRACQFLEFPIGHPIANQLYIGHPFIKQKYIPFENYHLQLVEDRVREFCQIAQSLGALEISIECLNSNSSDSTQNTIQGVAGGAKIKSFDGDGSAQREYSRHLIEDLSQTINLHQKFAPKAPPSLPDNLVWYKNEPSWQRLVEQRLSGTLLEHEERIETRKCQMVESQELKELKAELSTLLASINASFNQKELSQYQMQENTILSINIRFAPIEICTGDITLDSKTGTLSASELEYMDELKECLANGSISDSERRLLNKIRSKLGISEARAAELEQLLLPPQLTEDEQEYLDAFKDAMADGTISDAERRLLDKIKKYNNISDERAAEIEKMI